MVGIGNSGKVEVCVLSQFLRRKKQELKPNRVTEEDPLKGISMRNHTDIDTHIGRPHTHTCAQNDILPLQIIQILPM